MFRGDDPTIPVWLLRCCCNGPLSRNILTPLEQLFNAEFTWRLLRFLDGLIDKRN
jgi:hypothetical protein